MKDKLFEVGEVIVSAVMVLFVFSAIASLLAVIGALSAAIMLFKIIGFVSIIAMVSIVLTIMIEYIIHFIADRS